MITSHGVSESDIRNVLIPMLRDGTSPTVSNIRRALGYTGSPNTIQKHLKTVFARMAENDTSALPGNMPKELEDPLAVFWRSAIAHAQSLTDQQNADLQQRTEAAESELARLKGEHAEIAGRVDTLQGYLAERDEALSQAETRRREAESALATAREDVKRSSAHYNRDVAEAQTDADRQIRTITAERDHALTERDRIEREADQREQGLREQLEDQQAIREQLQADLRAADDTVRQLRTFHNDPDQQSDHTRAEQKRLEQRLERVWNLVKRLRQRTRRHYADQAHMAKMQQTLNKVRNRIQPATGRRKNA